METDSFSISELAKEFDISSRTIRFYEEKELLTPQRTMGNQRRYSPKDRFRLKWILRGKRFGYSLEEISKILSLTDTEMGAVQQIKTTLAYGEKKLMDIQDRMRELKTMQKEMLDLKEKLLTRLSKLESSQQSDPSNHSEPK